MAKFQSYEPEQAWLLPPRVRDVLGEEHLCFFIDRVVRQVDRSAFEQSYSDQGRPAYPPELLLKVWLYAYALGVTSTRRLEQRIREDLGFRFLAGGLQPDHWTLNEFRRRHPRALNDLFTQVIELAQQLGLGRLGRVAIDSTRVAANASRQKVDRAERLRRQRAAIRRQIRAWQQQCNAEAGSEAPGVELDSTTLQRLERRLEQIPRQLEQIEKGRPKQVSRTDPEARFLRQRGGFCLGYNVDLAVSEDHLIVAQRVGQQTSDNASLVPLVAQVEQQCGQSPEAVLADTGYFSLQQIEAVESRGIKTYVPDPNLAYELGGGTKARGIGKNPLRSPLHQLLRERLRSPEGRQIYGRRKGLVEPVIGVLKQQRGLRQFRRRGLQSVGVELALAATAFNLTRMWAMARRTPPLPRRPDTPRSTTPSRNSACPSASRPSSSRTRL